MMLMHPCTDARMIVCTLLRLSRELRVTGGRTPRAHDDQQKRPLKSS
jgi:hypothetical protein